MKPGTILLPTDFSDGNRDALETAALLARASGAELRLLHASVVEISYFVPSEAGASVALPESLHQEIEAQARRELARTVKELADPPRRISTHLRRGERAAEVVLAEAEDCGASLVVMSSHGRRGFRRLLLGSVTEEVVRRAPCPVLVVRRDPELRAPEPASRILAAVDFSGASDAIVAAARSLAALLELELELLHVQAPSELTSLAAPPDAVIAADVEAATTDAESDCRQRLLEIDRQTAGDDEPPARLSVRRGDPGAEIVDHAARNASGLIVVGTEGHTGIDRMLLGSVCEKVLRRAPCPVLVLPRAADG